MKKQMAETPSKDERLKEFFQRLASLQPASTFEEAYRQLCKTLDQVEDEMSGLPNEPERWMTLDRMFPPQSDRMSSVAGCDVKRFDNLLTVHGSVEQLSSIALVASKLKPSANASN